MFNCQRVPIRSFWAETHGKGAGSEKGPKECSFTRETVSLSLRNRVAQESDLFAPRNRVERSKKMWLSFMTGEVQTRTGGCIESHHLMELRHQAIKSASCFEHVNIIVKSQRSAWPTFSIYDHIYIYHHVWQNMKAFKGLYCKKQHQKNRTIHSFTMFYIVLHLVISTLVGFLTILNMFLPPFLPCLVGSSMMFSLVLGVDHCLGGWNRV